MCELYVKADPIESILFRMDQMHLSRKDLIPYIGSISKVSEVLSRKRPLSLPMIRRLNQGLGIPADILIEDVETGSTVVDQETEMDFTRFPLKEMLERGCFGDFEGNAQRLKEYAEDLVRKFMQDLLPKQVSPAFLRAPMHQRGDRQADEMALLAWRMCVLRQARTLNIAKEYKHGTITPTWLHELAKLSTFDEGPKLAREYLARHGITLVIEKHFKRTFLDGAAMLDNDRPIVALTLRHDRFDNFWFALLHELAHVAKHLLSFDGGQALSAFRAQALLPQLQAVCDRITGVAARHVHWVLCDAEPGAAERDKLAALLRYGDAWEAGTAVDALVVGGGTAGCCAALAARYWFSSSSMPAR